MPFYEKELYYARVDAKSIDRYRIEIYLVFKLPSTVISGYSLLVGRYVFFLRYRISARTINMFPLKEVNENVNNANKQKG